MKTFILLSYLGFLFLVQISGQNYNPMLGEKNEWFVQNSIFEGVTTTIFRANEDTLIDGKYYKILIEFDRYDWDYQNNIFRDSTIHGFLREDTVEQKVYIRSNSVSTGIDKEYIYIDFSVEAGDSIMLYNVNYYGVDSLGYSLVKNIEQINTVTGLRRGIYVEGEYAVCEEFIICGVIEGDITWVEGIGSLSNTCYPHTIPVPMDDACRRSFNALSCFYQNDTLVYQAEFSNLCGGDCFFEQSWGAINTNDLNDEILMYPNPAGENIHIENTSGINFQVNIYDIYGHLIIATDLLAFNDKLIDISILPKGIYYLQYMSYNGDFRNIKLVKY